jgi:hypothetical protein
MDVLDRTVPLVDHVPEMTAARNITPRPFSIGLPRVQ